MAYTFMCDNECGEQAAITVQILGTPDVMAFCVPCSAQWAEAHAATIREAIAQHELAQQYEADPDADVIPQAELDAEREAIESLEADELEQMADVYAGTAVSDDSTDTDERG